MEIAVLDHGFVRLVDHMGNDLSIVRSARVSYDADWREADKGKDINLLHYLMKNKHTSPFESVVFTFEVKAPIFVIRQWHRHRTWAYNEISARYTELPEEFYVPNHNVIGTQSAHNKQMRDINNSLSGSLDIIEAATSAQIMETCMQNAFTCYKVLLERGVPRELARSVLPVGTYTRMFATVSLHNLFHFLKLRLHEHSQYEIRVYAEAILELINEYVPISVDAFKKFILNQGDNNV